MSFSKRFGSILLILLSAACVDRLSFDLEGQPGFIPVIQGYISDLPGPYEVTLTRSFDIKLAAISRIPLSAKSLTILDDAGLKEELKEIREGVYQTSPSGIRGVVGRAYKLKIELDDGRVYESLQDTLLNSGELDSIYYSFRDQPNFRDIPNYGFDIFIDSKAIVKNNFRFLWKFTGTFQAETNPEYDRKGCYFYNGKCNFVPPCSGLINTGPFPASPIYERVAPCSCCTCWYSLYNTSILLHDDAFLQVGRFDALRVYFLPITGWIFTHKVHLDVKQFSLTRQTFDFWRAIRNQKDAIGSLFQPVSGKIPSNFVQLSGKDAPLAGIFYAASISSKTTYINRSDVPNEQFIPADKTPFLGSCLELFSNSTNVKPTFWID